MQARQSQRKTRIREWLSGGDSSYPSVAMKFAANRPFADPEAAARKLVEIATGIEPVPDGRIFIEMVNAPFLFQLGGKGTEFKAGIASAVERGWLDLHESGSFQRLTKSSADL